MTAPPAREAREAREAHVVAQAKVNLFLRVLAREAGGHHQLETLFQRLELGDDVRVRVGVSGRSLDCGGAELGPVERNLAWRAAEAYRAAAGWPDGYAIEVEKRIPVGGGLGGGSADAGAVLRALNALAPRPLDGGALLALAAPLGADVPFLTTEAPLALAWGRGERMLALPPLPARRAQLALFGEGVSTAEAFGALAAARAAGAAAPRPILWRPERLARWDDVALVASNDFEDVVFPRREDVAAVREMFDQVTRRVDLLHRGAAAGGSRDGGDDGGDGDTVPIALMSGSGATVFLLTPLDGVEVVFEVRGEGASTPGEPPEPGGLAFVETRTATRVAPVSAPG